MNSRYVSNEQYPRLVILSGTVGWFRLTRRIHEMVGFRTVRWLLLTIGVFVNDVVLQGDVLLLLLPLLLETLVVFVC